MKGEESQSSLRAIQVKGMNSLSVPYIKRYFTFAGSVEDVKKLGESVIVKFKYHSSAVTAHKFNGRVVDKQPIKIRNVSHATEDYFHKDGQKKVKEPSSKISRLKNSHLNLSKHWSMITETLQQIQSQKEKWMISELFCLKLQQIMHNYLYHSNTKAQYKQLKTKEWILNLHNCPQPYISVHNENVEIMQLKIDQPDKFQYESSFYSYCNDLDLRLRVKIKNMSKNEKKLQQLKYLYKIMENNSLILEEDSIIVPIMSLRKSSQTQSQKVNNLKTSYNKEINITVQNATQTMFQLKFNEDKQIIKHPQRCNFRSIDEEHPSKEIQVISDSHFHDNPIVTWCYTFFKNQFNGCLGNIGCKHIFHQFLPYSSPNYLLIRHYNMNRYKYLRLQYGLRLTNCQDQTLKQQNYYKVLECNSMSDLIQLQELKLAKNTIIFDDIQNGEKVVYNIKNYIRYMLTKAEDYYQESQNDTFHEKEFLIVLVLTLQKLQSCQNVLNLIFEGTRQYKKPKICLLCVTDDNEFLKKKCYYFLQNYVDKINGEMNEEIAKLRVQQLLSERPHEILEISHLQNYQSYVFQSLWKVYQEKSKRKTKNNIKSFMFSVRK